MCYMSYIWDFVCLVLYAGFKASFFYFHFPLNLFFIKNSLSLKFVFYP